ncbi:hypothetical protein LINPERPRIM_LOCUS7934 [Linum perenne]
MRRRYLHSRCCRGVRSRPALLLQGRSLLHMCREAGFRLSRPVRWVVPGR